MGIAIIVADIALYPSSLPKVIDSKNSYMIEIQSYIFYLLLFLGISIISLGIRKIIKIITKDFLKHDINNMQGNQNHSYLGSLFGLFTTMAYVSHSDNSNNKKFSMLFWSTAITYGLFFSVTSGTLIYSAHGLSQQFHIQSIPSTTIMSYGPVGLVPTLAIAVSENLGFLVIPINLIIMLLVSTLVGFNAMISLYAFMNKPKKNKGTSSSPASSLAYSGLGLIGAGTGLFTACSTCTSLFILNFLLGSFASSIAAFTAAFYTLFVAITIPLLLVTPVVTAIGIRRMQSTNNVCPR